MYDLSGDLGLTVIDDLPEVIVRMKERRRGYSTRLCLVRCGEEETLLNRSR